MATVKMLLIATFALTSFVSYPIDKIEKGFVYQNDPSDPENIYYAIITFQEGDLSLVDMRTFVNNFNNKGTETKKLRLASLYLNAKEGDYEPIIVICQFANSEAVSKYSEGLNIELKKLPEQPTSIYLSQKKYREVLTAKTLSVLND